MPLDRSIALQCKISSSLLDILLHPTSLKAPFPNHHMIDSNNICRSLRKPPTSSNSPKSSNLRSHFPQQRMHFMIQYDNRSTCQQVNHNIGIYRLFHTTVLKLSIRTS